MHTTNHQNEYQNEYRDEYLTLSALGGGEIVIAIPSSVDTAYASYLSYLSYSKEEIYSKDKSNWVEGVAPAGVFTKIAPMTSWSIGASGVPSGWAIVDYEVSKFARPARCPKGLGTWLNACGFEIETAEGPGIC